MKEIQMTVNMTKKGDWAVVSVEGRVDTVSAPEFEKKALEFMSAGEMRLLMDLAKLEYISSAGLRSLLVLAKKAKSAGGKLCCCALDSMVKKVFDVSGFTSIIPVFDTVEDAIGS
jgi:anti-anti-sigma factor